MHNTLLLFNNMDDGTMDRRLQLAMFSMRPEPTGAGDGIGSEKR